MAYKKCAFHEDYMGVCELARTLGVTRITVPHVVLANNIGFRHIEGSKRFYYCRKDVARVLEESVHRSNTTSTLACVPPPARRSKKTNTKAK